MRILVIGSYGQLGRELLTCVLDPQWEVVGRDKDTIDITDATALGLALDELQPDWIINCAAWTNVDGAESQETLCRAINVDGPAHLARWCASHDTRLLTIGTDFIYCNGDTQPRHEQDTPAPDGVYGVSKWDGEQEVRRILPDRHVVARTSWLFGQDGPNFVLTMLRVAPTVPKLNVVNDQWGSPSWTGSVAPAIWTLVAKEARGTFHLSNRGITTWRDFAVAILERAGIDTPVIPVSTEEYGALAPRPRASYLEDDAWRALGELPLVPWEEALEAYLAQHGKLVRSFTLQSPNTER